MDPQRRLCRCNNLLFLLVALALFSTTIQRPCSCHGFVFPYLPSTTTTATSTATISQVHDTLFNGYHRRHKDGQRLFASSNNDNKFGMTQRIDSVKSLVVGAVVGSVAQSPIALLHNVGALGSLAQWEFDTDAAALSAGLFAIVYRYCIRQDDNPQLNQGVIGAFCILRTVARIQVPSYCTAIPLTCGNAPLGVLDWNILQQVFWSGAESVAIFGCTAYALDVAMERGYISKFPN